jgi:hypothetical protein
MRSTSHHTSAYLDLGDVLLLEPDPHAEVWVDEEELAEPVHHLPGDAGKRDDGRGRLRQQDADLEHLDLEVVASAVASAARGERDGESSMFGVGN